MDENTKQSGSISSEKSQRYSGFRKRPTQKRGQKRVDLLLDAAADLIAEQGMAAATAEAIALRANTAKGSLYQFFPNSNAVIEALAMRFADELKDIQEKSFESDPCGIPIEDLIERIVNPLARFHDKNPAFRRVFMAVDAPLQSTPGSPRQPGVRSQLFDSMVGRLEALFALRNPSLSAKDRSRAALVAAAIGQAVLAKRHKAGTKEKKLLQQDLVRILSAYLGPLLDCSDSFPPTSKQ